MSVTEHTRAARTPGALLPRPLAVLLLLAGPLATIAAAHALAGAGRVAAADLPVISVVALVFWSPLPISFPALLLQDARDRALPRLPRAARAVALIPYLACSPASAVRVETVAALAGFGFALARVAGWA